MLASGEEKVISTKFLLCAAGGLLWLIDEVHILDVLHCAVLISFSVELGSSCSFFQSNSNPFVSVCVNWSTRVIHDESNVLIRCIVRCYVQLIIFIEISLKYY